MVDVWRRVRTSFGSGLEGLQASTKPNRTINPPPLHFFFLFPFPLLLHSHYQSYVPTAALASNDQANETLSHPDPTLLHYLPPPPPPQNLSGITTGPTRLQQ